MKLALIPSKSHTWMYGSSSVGTEKRGSSKLHLMDLTAACGGYIIIIKHHFLLIIRQIVNNSSLVVVLEKVGTAV